MKKKVIVIAGPTAAGKTSASIKLAKQLGTEIVSADSRQCYREMNIGVARPSDAELAEVPHHFIATHSIHQPVNAADFEGYALEAVSKIFKKSDYAVMVGGTGLYIKAFCEGLDRIPPVPAEVHEQVNKDFEANGVAWLQAEVARLDPMFFADGEIENPHRLLRALEVVIATGTSIRTFQSGSIAVRDFEIEKLGIAPPKEVLHSQINQRVDAMIAAGQLEEARGLFEFRNLVPLQTVGYSELFEYFDGKMSLPQAIELIKLRTRQYSKRQLTWFKKQDIKWFNNPTMPLLSEEGKSRLRDGEEKERR